MVKKMQGDSAPCGTTHSDVAAPLLLNHAGSAARSAFWCILCILWFLPHMQCFCGFVLRCLIGGYKKVAEGGPSATKKVIVGVISRVLYPFGCQSFN